MPGAPLRTLELQYLEEVAVGVSPSTNLLVGHWLGYSRFGDQALLEERPVGGEQRPVGGIRRWSTARTVNVGSLHIEIPSYQLQDRLEVEMAASEVDRDHAARLFYTQRAVRSLLP